MTLQESGNLIKAIELYHEALTIEPKNAPVLNNLGASLMYMGDELKGVQYLHQSIEISPYNPQAYINLKTFYMEEGMYT